MKQIAEALLEAQKELPLIIQRETRGHHNSYTSLELILQRVRPVLNKHGIIVIQVGDLVAGQVVCRTRLLHSSGEFVEGQWPVLEARDQKLHPAQAAGQGWTYARRYSLAAILGLGTGDQDVDSQAPPEHNGSTTGAAKQNQPPDADIIHLETVPSANPDEYRVQEKSTAPAKDRPLSMEERERFIDRVEVLGGDVAGAEAILSIAGAKQFVAALENQMDTPDE